MLSPVHGAAQVTPDPIDVGSASDGRLEAGFGPTPSLNAQPKRGPIHLLSRWIGRRVAVGVVGFMIGFGLAAGAPLDAQTVKPEAKVTSQVEVAKRVEVRVAKEDAKLTARLLDRRPLVYAGGADASLDRPAHVRAASGAAWIGGKLAVVQDDANFIAVVDPATGRSEAIALPPGSDGKRVFEDARANKKLKMDLEACVTIRNHAGALFLGIGSGSAPARESIVVMNEKLEPRVVPAKRLYAALRELVDFAGSELNVEGIVDMGDGTLRLFQRGNGKAADGRQPVNATVDIDQKELLAFLEAPDTARVPALRNPVQYDLGKIDGIRVTFNDAVKIDGGISFLASAEDSPDAIRDGRVSGSIIGIIDDHGNVRYGHLTDEKGAPLTKKPEGLALDPGDRTRILLFTDADEGDAPAEVLSARLE